MPTMNPAVLNQFLIPFVEQFFFVFGIVGVVVGVGLVVNHVRMHQFFVVMDRWVSTRHSTKWLAVPHDIAPAVQRFPRLIGATFVVLAAFSTFVLIAQLDVNKVVDVLGIAAPHAYVAWVVDCVRWFLIAGGILAIAVGAMLIFRPSALRSIESTSGRWYSFRRHSQSGDAMHMGFDAWIENHPLASGSIIAVAALVVVVEYGVRLFARA